jgi:hypothetical protein
MLMLMNTLFFTLILLSIVIGHRAQLQDEGDERPFSRTPLAISASESSSLANGEPRRRQMSASSCELSNFYSSIGGESAAFPDSASAEDIDSTLLALISPHNRLPYSSNTATDCWDALQVLDATPLFAKNITLIYSQRSEWKEMKTNVAEFSTSGWNREHVFPKSFGVGTSGPDTTDVLSLRACDMTVNSARNNRYFDYCTDADVCTIPANEEATADTGLGNGIISTGKFMPPAAVRGDLARSIFYMATRYDGSESYTEDLKISNCPWSLSLSPLSLCLYAFVCCLVFFLTLSSSFPSFPHPSSLLSFLPSLVIKLFLWGS